MNEALLTRNLWLEYIFLGTPATILIIKMILEHIVSKVIEKRRTAKIFLRAALEEKYDCFNFYTFYNADVYVKKNEYGFIVYDEEKKEAKTLSPEEVNEKYPDLESDYQKLQKLENANPKLKKISHFLDKLSIYESVWWILYCAISWILLLSCIICMATSPAEFNTEKAFYDNGKYTTITQFEKYESFPDWNKNAKAYIRKAEDLNNTYFNIDGSIKTEVLGYIIPDENGKYPILDDTGSHTGKYLEPININQMYKSFLKICQSEEEIRQ